mmetsp:Transcript_6201/g.13509  ORF Transcript_6201/g.13509 Transcript_6201/m.13509 type:complete len:455 (+) Transcript_6201:125-1489(+)
MQGENKSTMKLFALALVLMAAPCATAFAPAGLAIRHASASSSSSSPSARSMTIDPSTFGDLPHQAAALQHAFSSLLVSDVGLVDAVMSGAADNAAEAAGAVAGMADVASNGGADAAAAATDNGWFGFFAGPIEFLLQTIHKVLVTAGAPSNAWGISIVLMTVIIKVLTYPLTKSQLESTTKMQTLQPTIKEIQAKYQSNPEVMNQKISELYQTNEVNPLAGCIPSLVQIPVFIGLYRAILNLAKSDTLEESFLWLPNLEGPTYGADPAHASDWILKNWQDGVPPLGWDDTAAFLTIPVILVISQFISMQLMQPKVEGQEQPAFLKILPLMIGWFSLNVPAALGVYWVANNFITTAISVQIRSGLDKQPVSPVVGSSSSSVIDAPTTSTFTPAPIREKPSGFAESAASPDEVTPITPIDNEIVDSVVEEDTAQQSKPSGGPSKKRGKKKKKKKRS